MDAKWPVILTVALVLLAGGIIYLAQAIEPPRETAVEVLDNDRFVQ